VNGNNALRRQQQPHQQQHGHVHTDGHGSSWNASRSLSLPFPLSPTTTVTTTAAATTTLAATRSNLLNETRRNFSANAKHGERNGSKWGASLCSSLNLSDEKAKHIASQHSSMAGVQKLAVEPSREHIENIRHLLMNINAKDNNDQSITLEKDEENGIGIVCIKSAAKNGISAKMMCDFLDVIDQLYAWPEGKGVLIYGHGGFFSSG